MTSKQIKLIMIVGVCAFLLCGCQIRSSTIVLKDKTKEKPKTESAVRVENGVIIYKDTKNMILPKFPKKGIKRRIIFSGNNLINL